MDASQFVSVPFWQLVVLIVVALFAIGVGVTYWLRDTFAQGAYKAQQRIEFEKQQGTWPPRLEPKQPPRK